jgi:hypothetical protein
MRVCPNTGGPRLSGRSVLGAVKERANLENSQGRKLYDKFAAGPPRRKSKDVAAKEQIV